MALEVIAAHVPDLHHVAAATRAAGAACLGLDATLMPTDRVAPRAEGGHEQWFSGKRRATAGTCRSSATRRAVRYGGLRRATGAVHDLTGARVLVLPALHPHADGGLPVPADRCYTGGGTGVRTAVKWPASGVLLHIDMRCYSRLPTPTERDAPPAPAWSDNMVADQVRPLPGMAHYIA